jgi:alpha-galactosidase
VLGLYDVLGYLNEKYPELVIESCASGGCRFDGGMLGYSTPIWTSDNTDALSRSMIQYGTSYVYPLSAMSCHVSACPNAQTGRTIDLISRYHMASLGAFGYELDPGSLSDEELQTISRFNAEYRRDEDLVLRGDLYRIANPALGNLFAEIIVSKDKRKAKLTILIPRCEPNGILRRLQIPGLAEDFNYTIVEKQEQVSGALLAAYGLDVPMTYGDCKTIVYHFSAE